ncbi:MAG TPA: hypothetical protein DEA08_26830 [Planctomycetes bacterium]|nr:hypothetical protein [Planctomycetota bacterium]
MSADPVEDLHPQDLQPQDLPLIERLRRALGLERPEQDQGPALHEDAAAARAFAWLGWGLIGFGTLCLALWRLTR